ncbi:MAG TPA: hypothetical protein VGR70_03035 [Stellaceae bacterium]|nr:hypothetical protein [Stellaceae bacterium]
MSDPQSCLNKLRALAAGGAGNPHKAAAKIVEKFAADASKAEYQQLRMRLEDTLIAGRYTDVSAAYLDQHSRWLAVLEGACAAAKERRSSR